jgi:hypothetical protein
MVQQNNKTIMTGITGKLQIFELKQIADMEAAYKDRAQKAIEDYKAWKNAYDEETDIINLIYGQLEGRHLRLQAQNAVTAYWTIRKDFKILFTNYIKKSSSRTLTYKSRLAA